VKPPAALDSAEAMAIKPVLLATIQQLRAQAWGAMPLLALLLGLTFLSMLFGSALRINGIGRGLRVRFGMPRVWRMQLRTDLVVLGEAQVPAPLNLIDRGCSDRHRLVYTRSGSIER
jgi:hypothetical protein